MIIAIDLGTSNSLVGVWQDGRHVLIPNSLGKMLTPSAVSLLDSGEVVVGEAARDRLLTHPASSAGGFKRFMGSDRPILLDRRPFRAEELSALVLGALKADAEAWLGARVSEAVITVPAYFNDLQRQATRAAGQLAGLKVERLLNEPTAAALAYGLAQFSDQGHDQARILVVDLGGGTFDVSILELFDGVMEVRATAGDNFLGGEDFVDAIVDAFHAAVGRAAGLPARGEADTHPAYVALRRQAELAKRSLSDHQAATLHINLNQQTLTWSLTQEQFVDISEPLLQRLRRPLAQAVKDARLDPAELTQIVLAGGATRMPAVRKMIARMFGRLPAQTINPDEVVARGAAVQAGLKMRDAALEEVVMTDVAPFSLGIETSRIDANEVRQFGLFAPILERNTVIPASRVQRFFTIRDNQTKIDIEIFQGEARKVSDNIRLGKMSLVVPRAPAGQESVDVRFTYDVSGMLEVEVTVTSTGEVVSTLIEGSAQALSAAEIAARRERLAALKIHPRDQAENRAALSRAERLFEECLGTTRSRVGTWVDDFVAALDSQDGKRIDLARRALLQHLAEIDRDPFEG